MLSINGPSRKIRLMRSGAIHLDAQHQAVLVVGMECKACLAWMRPRNSDYHDGLKHYGLGDFQK